MNGWVRVERNTVTDMPLNIYFPQQKSHPKHPPLTDFIQSVSSEQYGGVRREEIVRETDTKEKDIQREGDMLENMSDRKAEEAVWWGKA